MSNPTSEEILESLNTGKGLTVEYVEYVYQLKDNGTKDYSNPEKINHGSWPAFRSEVPDEAPDYVKNGSITLPEYAEPAKYVVRELATEADSNGLKSLGTPVKQVEWVGGEGEGDHAHIVLGVGEFFFRADFTYASWDGFYYEGAEFREVRPKEIVVIEYV